MQLSLKMEEELTGRSRNIEAIEKINKLKICEKMLKPIIDVNKWYKQCYAKDLFCLSKKRSLDERVYSCTYGFNLLFHESRLFPCAEYSF